MATYSFRAVGADGQTLDGLLDATDEEQAVALLQGRGLIPLAVKLGAGRTAPARPATRLFGGARVKPDQLAALTRDLATLLRAGLPLDRALEILIGMSQTPAIQALLTQVRDDIRGGDSLSKALEAHPGVFDRFYVGMVRAGEAGGALHGALQRIAEFMDRAKELRETVASALVYPTILVVTSLASVLLLLVFVVPQFSQMFEQSGKALPLATQIVINAGEWVRHYGWTVPLCGFLLWRYVAWQRSFPAGRRFWDARILSLGLVGDLVTKVEVARFSRTLATLLTNGLPLLPALSIVRETIGNAVIAESVENAREQLQAGHGLSGPLLQEGTFPPLAGHMMGVGEETGQLDQMLDRIAEVYDREVSLAVKRMLALLEPVLILGLGLVIGGIILSILMAILKVNSLVG